MRSAPELQALTEKCFRCEASTANAPLAYTPWEPGMRLCGCAARSSSSRRTAGNAGPHRGMSADIVI